jgi:flagellar motor switch protein FliN/FliY
MAEEIDLQPLSTEDSRISETTLGLEHLAQIPVELAVELGRAHLTVGEALGLDIGSIVSLERTAGEPADLLINGTLVARGEVVVVEERFGLRITEIFESGKPSLSAAADNRTEPEAEEEQSQG